MRSLLKFGLLVVLALLMVEVVIAVAARDTGVVEKVVLVGLGACLVAAAGGVWQIGTRRRVV